MRKKNIIFYAIDEFFIRITKTHGIYDLLMYSIIFLHQKRYNLKLIVFYKALRIIEANDKNN